MEILRSCINCRIKKDKRELYRFVMEEDLAIDNTGKRVGRGAYLCEECLAIYKSEDSNKIKSKLRNQLKNKNERSRSKKEKSSNNISDGSR